MICQRDKQYEPLVPQGKELKTLYTLTPKQRKTLPYILTIFLQTLSSLLQYYIPKTSPQPITPNNGGP